MVSSLPNMSKGQKILALFAVIGLLAILSRGWLIAALVALFGLAAVFFDELCQLGESLWDRIFS